MLPDVASKMQYHRCRVGPGPGTRLHLFRLTKVATTYGDVVVCPRRSLRRVVVGVEHTEGIPSGHQPVGNGVPQASPLVEIRDVKLTRVRIVERGDGLLLIWNRGVVNLQRKRAGSSCQA